MVYDTVINPDQESWKELEDEAKAYRQGLHSESTMGHRPPEGKTEHRAHREIRVDLDNHTRKRGQVFSEVATTLAELRPDVQNFRWTYLQGRLLTEEEANAFLEERATGQRILDRGFTARSMLDWRAVTLAYFYGWSKSGAARFILTGRAPEYQPVRVEVEHGESRRFYVPNSARVGITADVWVDAEEVKRPFGTAQRQLLGGYNRKKPDRMLEVARFVAQHIRVHGARPPWPRLWKLWNESCPSEWRYNDYRGFRQAFERFVHPAQNLPQWKRNDTTDHTDQG